MSLVLIPALPGHLIVCHLAFAKLISRQPLLAWLNIY